MDNELRLRPKPKFGIDDDAEDEMLNYQELFRRSNTQPAAQVIREPKTKRQHSDDDSKKIISDDASSSSTIDISQTTVMRPVIVERDISKVEIKLPTLVNDAFPEAHHRGGDDLDKITLPHVKKASLFAKQMYRDGQLKTCKDLDVKTTTGNSRSRHTISSTLLTGSGLGEVTGEREMKRIHDENIERLQSMNEMEILAEKEKLLKTLDPKVIAFIRKRTQKENEIPIENVKMETDNRPTATTTPTTTNLPIDVDSKWLHMDNVEHEKLEWMKDLPRPLAQAIEGGVPARFDFKGNLISRTTDIAVTAALHHHGDEPEAAGYTLDELFHLTRSTVLQQRVIALQTLANIIAQAHTGVYDRDLQSPLLPKLIEAGLVFVIRWAMDEQIEIVYMLAIECMANLIAPKSDEDALARTCHWPCGYLEPILTPPELQLGEKKIESDLTDIELLQQDLIKCLFRMNLLKRLVYLLDRMKFLPSTITTIIPIKRSFDILIRMARHSMTCAHQIFDDRQLMDFIIREFVPESSTHYDENLYGCLLPETLKLCRILASYGSSLASNLIHRYALDVRLRNHLATAANLPLSVQIDRTLAELLSLWRVLILQGHLADEFGSLIPTIVLPMCRICIQQMPNGIIVEILIHLVTLFDALIVHVTKLVYKDPSEESSTCVNWSHINGLFDLLLTISKQTMIETDEQIPIDALRTACLSCLASYLIGQHVLKIDLLDLPSKTKLLRIQLLEPVLRLQTTKQIIETRQLETTLLPTNTMFYLPTLTQMELSSSSFGFLTALLRLMNIIYTIDKTSVSNQWISNSLLKDGSQIWIYIKKILLKLTTTTSRVTPWFERFEHVFIFQLAQVLIQEKSNDNLPSIFYEILLAMLPSLLQGHQYLAEIILKFLLFDTSFWKRSDETDLADLTLTSNAPLRLASNEILSSSHRSILYERAIEHLPSLYHHYMNILQLVRSTQSLQFSFVDIHIGLLIQFENGPKLNIHYSHLLIDRTWPYGLLSSLYSNVLRIVESDRRLDLILNMLRLIYIFEMKRCVIMTKMLSITTRFSMIAGIYLLGSDIFLDKNIADYLVAFLNCFNEQNLLQKIDTRANIESLMTFFDFYRSLVDQYEACSFGDILFSNYLLVPLQQTYDIQLRKHVWIEHSTILIYFRLKPDQILFALESFFIPWEIDIDMIRYYAQILLQKTIRKEVQPLLYMIAVHHLNAFLFDQIRTEQIDLQRTIVKNLQIASKMDQILYNDVINYKTFSREGSIPYTTLPSLRSNWLQRLLQ